MTAPRPVLDLKLLEPGADQAEPRGGRGRPPRHLADLDADDRKARAAELGVPAFRIDQVARHYFSRLTDPGDPSAMTDLPAAGRDDLVWALLPPLLDPVREVTCDDGKTRKTLWRLHDGALVESVLMSYPGRATVCVSSQAGCGMACPFCATGQGGLTRNLSTAEIVDQVVAAARACAHGALGSEDGVAPQQLSNVVFMGMGEPLANYARVVAALRQLVAKPPAGLGLSRRGITVSTVGLVPGIEKLTREDLPVTLALSLHAPDDELRNTLVPVNTRWPVAEVLAAAGRYGTVTGRRVSIEYALMRDINDQRERAALLADALREHFDGGRLVHVNLIPLNPTPGSPWTASEPGVQEAFVSVLRGGGIATTVRDTRGREIDGACGQLAAAE